LAVFYRTYADLLRPVAQDAARRLEAYLAAQETAAAGEAKMARMSANVSAKPSRKPRKG